MMIELVVIVYVLAGYHLLWRITDFDAMKASYEKPIMQDNLDLLLVFVVTIIFWPIVLFIWWKYAPRG